MQLSTKIRPRKGDVTIATPPFEAKPCIYVVHFSDGTQYIGQTQDLNQRFKDYSNKTASQDRRVCELAVADIEVGGSIFLEILDEVEFEGEVLDTTMKLECQAAEGITIARALRKGITLHNL